VTTNEDARASWTLPRQWVTIAGGGTTHAPEPRDDRLCVSMTMQEPRDLRRVIDARPELPNIEREPIDAPNTHPPETGSSRLP
jgi:hypothetical protein